LYAYIYDNDTGYYYCVYKGIKEAVVIASDNSGTVQFSLSPITDNEGMACIYIQLPPGNDVASVETIIDGKALDPPLEIKNGIIEYYDTLEAGDYFIAFILKDGNGNTLAVISEILVIRNRVWSIKTFFLSNDDFNVPPAAPVNFKGDNYTGGKITLSWENISRNETGFILNDGILDHEISAGSTSYTFQVGDPLGMSFSLIAMNDFGKSEEPDYTVVVPETPTGLSEETSSASGVTLFWEPVTGASAYTILGSTSYSGDFTPVGTSTDSTFTVTDLLPDTIYYFTVIANGLTEDSPASDVILVQTKKVNTFFTVSYNLNGGTGTTPAAQKVNAGSSVTLASGTGLTKSGYTFGGWNTVVSNNETTYNAGSSYTPIDNIVLYARWNIVTNYTYTITNNYTRAIDAAYIRKIGNSSWSVNLITSAVAAGAQCSLGTFEAGQYEIKLVSTKLVQTSSISSSIKLSTNRPATTGIKLPSSSVVTVYQYIDNNLDSNQTISVTATEWVSDNR